ncbi:hypothetical protein [Hymenobacter sp. 5414T-23]|uniref:hypothetical protein n=1 Tax=Hymenobacter sp. 5414T-23 TaxID=2932252 RepID=UPI001FD08B92|nr:hypothetical protein [Hymenobacter sp. 5414T-23]UOQ83305.1 hypothetical protein MUN83_21035 [Hymenobacter sp. 5414T-23]
MAAFAALFAPGSRATLATYAPALQRFREPIEAALRHCGHGRASERLRATCWLLYYEMHGRQRSLWGWSEADWVDIAGVSTAAFATAQPALKAAHHLAHTHFRTCVVACAYLLGEVNIYQRITEFRPLLAARRIFGPGAVHAAIAAVKAELGRIGRGSESLKSEIGNAVSLALLSNRSPALTDLTLPVLEQVLEQVGANKWLRRGCIQTSEALYMLGLLPRPLPAVRTVVTVRTGQQDTLPAAWAALIQRWSETTTVSPATRDGLRVSVAKAGRWAAHTFPTTADPAQWTAEMALAYVAAVVRMTGGEWNHPGTRTAAALVGKPCGPPPERTCSAICGFSFSTARTGSGCPASSTPTAAWPRQPALPPCAAPTPA